MSGKWRRNMSDNMEYVLFSGAKPISLVRFLDTFVEQANADHVPEVIAVKLAAEFLRGNAKNMYVQAMADRGGVTFYGGFNTWPGAVNHLISVWLTDDVLDEAVSRLRAITQQQTKPVAKYHERFTTLARETSPTSSHPRRFCQRSSTA